MYCARSKQVTAMPSIIWRGSKSLTAVTARRLSSATRTAIVTGGSSGIGREVAASFRSRGWAVHNISRTPCTVEGVINHKADLTKTLEAARVGEEIAVTIGKTAEVCLVHNAASHESDSAAKFDVNAMTSSMQLSIISPGVLTDKLLPVMSRGSSLIFVGSTLSEKAVAGRASYVTSKHAVIGLMRSYTQDLFGLGVHSAVVCPGFTDTPMLQSAMEQDPEGARKFIQGFVSVGRLITPREIASLIVFVAENPSVNGSVLHANGGQKET